MKSLLKLNPPVEYFGFGVAQLNVIIKYLTFWPKYIYICIFTI